MSSNPSTRPPLRIVLYGNMTLPNESRLRQKADFPFTVVGVPDDAGIRQREEAIIGAEAVVCVAFDHPAKHAPGLRLIQTQSAGYERVGIT